MFGLNTDKAIVNNNTNQYRLSIQVSLDGFSFLVFSESNKKIVSAKNSAIKISSPKLVSHHFKDWVHNEPLLKLQYRKVDILFFEEFFTLIPDAALQVPATEKLINPEGDRKIFQNKIEAIDTTLKFGVNTDLADAVKALFGKTEWIHPVSAMLNNFRASSKPNTGILIQSQNHYFFVLKKRSQLLLANCFKAEHHSDLVYLLLNTFRQLGVSRSLTHLMIAETIDNNGKLNLLLSPYFPSVSGLNIETETVQLTAGINPTHLFLLLNYI